MAYTVFVTGMLDFAGNTLQVHFKHKSLDANQIIFHRPFVLH